MGDETAGVYDDLGEQSVWRRLYPEIHELPAGYCALKAANFSAANCETNAGTHARSRRTRTRARTRHLTTLRACMLVHRQVHTQKERRVMFFMRQVEAESRLLQCTSLQRTGRLCSRRLSARHVW